MSRPPAVAVPGPGRRGIVVTLIAVAAAAAAVLGGCSARTEPASVTTTTRPPLPEVTAPLDPPGRDADPGEVLRPDWVLQVGGPGDDELAAAAGRRDRVVAVGSTTGLSEPAGGGRDVWVVVATSAEGALVASTQTGSAGADGADAVGAAPTGAAMTCGWTGADLGAAPAGGTDAWCAAVDPDGRLGPVRQSGTPGDDRLTGAAVTDDGAHAFAVGSTDGLFRGAQDPTGGFLGETDALVQRTDPDGLPRWVRQFGSAAVDRARAVTAAGDGDALVAGDTADARTGPPLGGGDAWLARFDPFGNQRWQTAFGSTGADSAAAVAVGGEASRGTEVVAGAGTTAGTVAGRTSAGGTDALVAAADSSGRLRWVTQFGSTADDGAAGVVVDGPTTYVAGTLSAPMEGAERVDLPGAESPAGGGRDGFLAALDTATGELRWAVVFGSAGDDDVTGLTRTEDGHLVLAGRTTGQLGRTAPAGGTDGFLIGFPLPSTGGGAASIL